MILVLMINRCFEFGCVKSVVLRIEFVVVFILVISWFFIIV